MKLEVKKWIMLMMDDGSVESEEFMIFCQKFMRMGQEIGVDIGAPIEKTVFKVESLADFYKWAEGMKRFRLNIKRI